MSHDRTADALARLAGESAACRAATDAELATLRRTVAAPARKRRAAPARWHADRLLSLAPLAFLLALAPLASLEAPVG